MEPVPYIIALYYMQEFNVRVRRKHGPFIGKGDPLVLVDVAPTLIEYFHSDLQLNNDGSVTCNLSCIYTCI